MTREDAVGQQGKKEFNPGESKHDRFKRLSNSRVEAIRDKIRLLGNLSNKRHYDYGQKDVDRMFSQVEEELRRAKGKFDTGLKREKK